MDTTAGKVRGSLRMGIHAFKGIPYGASTAGAIRFMAPAKAAPWTGVRETVRFGHQSPQNMRFTEVLAPQADPAEGFDEDCLNLNVWTPGVNDGRKRPVMFWCHGGGFAQESGSWPWIDGESLARRGDAVVVTVNHRLTVFGYLHLADIGGAKYAASGNAGCWISCWRSNGCATTLPPLEAIPECADLRRVWWRSEGVHAADHAGSDGAVPSRRDSERCQSAFGHARGRQRFHQSPARSPPGATEPNRHAADDADRSHPRDHRGGARRGAGSRWTDEFRSRDGRIDSSDASVRSGASPVSATVPLLVGCTAQEQTLFALTDEAAFNLDDAGLCTRVEQLVGAGHAERVVATYRKAHPKETPSGLYFLISTDRGMRMNAIRLSERKVTQAQAPVYMYLFAWQSPALSGRLRAAHTVEIPFVFDTPRSPRR